MLALDKKDRVLLFELDRNSRQPLSRLAKKAGLGKDATRYRLDRLLDAGIIRSFNAVVDTGKLGYLSFRLFLKFYSLSPQKERELLDYLLGNPSLLWMVQVRGAFDLNTWFLYRSVGEMNACWEDLLARFGNHIASRSFGIYTRVTCFGHAFLLGKRESGPARPFITTGPAERVDEDDLAIIRALANDARITAVELARQTGLSDKTVLSRIRRLEQRKIILGYRAGLDMEKLGYVYYKLHVTTFNVTPEKRRRLSDFIRAHPHVVFETAALGGFDAELEVQVEGEDALRGFLDELRGKFADIIRGCEVLHYYKEHRLRFFPAK